MKLRTTIGRGLALHVGAAVLLGGHLVSAEAQSQSQTQQDAGENKPQAGNGLEEVVVTAQKRREELQNVPIAITAVEGATLEKAGVTTVGDLVQLAPSLQFGTRSTNVFIAMRGIGQ